MGGRKNGRRKEGMIARKEGYQGRISRKEGRKEGYQGRKVAEMKVGRITRKEGRE